MKILVYPHQLVMGGSQINAIELAAAVRDRGHHVTVTAPQGLLASMIGDLGLDYVPTPVASTFPSARTALHLARLSRRLEADLVHAYEWRPAVEATFGPHLFRRTPLLVTVLSMQVPGFLPQHVPLVVGTRDLARQPGQGRRIHVLEPPIDTRRNRSSDSARARARWGFSQEDVVVSVVCRLTHELEKVEGVLEAINAVEALAPRAPVRLLIAGGGEGLEDVRRKANEVNRRAGRRLVLVAGEMLDPRDAYEAADIVIGMGSSALKGMSFSRPLVVQGTGGFWRLLDGDSADMFLRQGWFGHGGRGAADLELALGQLAGDSALRTELGRLGRALVQSHFSLDRAAGRLIDIYEETAATSVRFSSRLPSLCRSAARVAKFGAVTGFRAVSSRALR